MADHAVPTVWWKDALERVAWTFVQATASALVLDGTDLLDLDAWEAAGLGGVAAVLAVVKTIAASRLGRHNDAALPSPLP